MDDKELKQIIIELYLTQKQRQIYRNELLDLLDAGFGCDGYKGYDGDRYTTCYSIGLSIDEACENCKKTMPVNQKKVAESRKIGALRRKLTLWAKKQLEIKNG